MKKNINFIMKKEPYKVLLNEEFLKRKKRLLFKTTKSVIKNALLIKAYMKACFKLYDNSGYNKNIYVVKQKSVLLKDLADGYTVMYFDFPTKKYMLETINKANGGR